ncbi:MAG: hypothetical protein QHJ73_17210, partial [Armatimonadota bacterium]|nr:hypothetical protein [Armatimonadota bacterium]
TTYRRTSWLIDVDERYSYVVDLVRVRGGNTHTISWHGPPGPVTTTGLTLVKQQRGTYAGEEVAFEALAPDWRNRAGWSFLYNVERAANPPEYFAVDYQATDTRGRIAAPRQPHLRLHNLTELQEVALADGDPPQNKPQAPRRMRFVLGKRVGKNLDSCFVSVLEPYDATPFLTRVRRLQVLEAAPGTNPAAVEVTTADGRVDTVVSCEAPGLVRIEGGITLNGSFAFLARRGGRLECAKLMGGTLLQCDAFRLTAETGAYTGTVARVLADDPNNQQIELSEPLPGDQAGRTLIVQNDGRQDAAYTLEGPPQGTRVSVGSITLVRGFVDPGDHAKGYRYNVNPGDAYRVPTFVYVDLSTNARQSNTRFTVR